MITEHIHEGIRYTLSNDGLKKGDEVFPIAFGRIGDDGAFILHNFNFKEYVTDFPDEPHIILNLNYSTYKPYEIQTNKGYGPIEKYYKIIKREQKVKDKGNVFITYKWIEI